MHGWQFYDDQAGAACSDTIVCRLVTGPGTAAAGQTGLGSALLATVAPSEGKALVLQQFTGVRLDAIRTLQYQTFRQSVDQGNNLAIALQLNVDFDLTDQAEFYQGRLVFEPYQQGGGAVVQDVWQTWNTLSGRWWGTKSTVWRNGVSVSNPCVQSNPCTLATLLAAFPNIGIHHRYGAIVLKAGSGWSGFRGNVDALVIQTDSINNAFDFERARPNLVSALPPATPPSYVDADSEFVQLLGATSGMLVHRRLLSVYFADSTSAATRSAVIARVGGRVVGGDLDTEIGNGAYYVEVPIDSSGSRNEQLARALDTLPSVITAYALARIPGDSAAAYRRPVDGANWRDWKLDAKLTSPARHNWALESIRAPFAWGCATGSSSTNVAVVDFTFHTESELRSNLVYTNARDVAPVSAANAGTWHGDAVAELMAAQGNDSSGMTGVMWRAALREYDANELQTVGGVTTHKGPIATVTQHSLTQAVVAAAMGGARVINFSGQVPYKLSNSAADSTFRASWARTLVSAMTIIESRHRPLPLLVIAAGNWMVPAFDAGFPQLLLHPRYGKYAIVVGASSFGTGATMSPWIGNGQGTNYGALVSVFAPGSGVFATVPNGSAQPITGTSFAAPLVAGVAGLMFSFDSTLDAATVKRRLLEGAVNGNRVGSDGQGGTKPFLDAYEALKAIAAQPGAPLCGNRVWNDGNNNIIAERGSGTETIVSRNTSDYAAYVHPYHGGKRIDLGFSYEYDWTPATHAFTEVSYTNAPVIDYSGSWLGYTYVSDHDNAMWVERKDEQDPAGGQATRVRLLSVADGHLVKDLLSHHAPGTVTDSVLTGCLEEWPVDTNGDARPVLNAAVFSRTYACQNLGSNGSWDSEKPVLAVPSPQGDVVYVPVNIRHIYYATTSPTVGCSTADTSQATRDSYPFEIVVRRCGLQIDVDTAVRAMVYRIDTLTATWTPIALTASGDTTLEHREINSVEVSEDGKELIMSSNQRAKHFTYDINECQKDSHDWISVDTSTAASFPAGTHIRTVFLPAGSSCGGSVEAGATVAPDRIGTRTMQLKAAPEPTKPVSHVRQRRPDSFHRIKFRASGAY
jgi:hypothetical protein